MCVLLSISFNLTAPSAPKFHVSYKNYVNLQNKQRIKLNVTLEEVCQNTTKLLKFQMEIWIVLSTSVKNEMVKATCTI